MGEDADEVGLRRHFDGVERSLDRLDGDRAGGQAEPFERGIAYDRALRTGRRPQQQELGGRRGAIGQARREGFAIDREILRCVPWCAANRRRAALLTRVTP